MSGLTAAGPSTGTEPAPHAARARVAPPADDAARGQDPTRSGGAARARVAPCVGTPVVRLPGGGRPETDSVAVEEPLEVRIASKASEEARSFAVVMRTPGDDFDLAWGLALTEGIVASPQDIESAHWGEPADFNAVVLRLAEGVEPPDLSDRPPWLSTASCGLCGKDSIESLAKVTGPLRGPGEPVRSDILVSLPDRLRREQSVFEATGGLHAAGAFTIGGDALCVREDIGRHNAVDKVVGHLAATGRLPGENLVMVVSGRAGFEIVQKTAAAGIGVLVSVSAPSSLAVELAVSLGMTLAGFVRNGSANIYSGYERILP